MGGSHRHEGHNAVTVPSTYAALSYAFSAYRFLSVDNVQLFHPAMRTLRAPVLKDTLLAGCQAIVQQRHFRYLPQVVDQLQRWYDHECRAKSYPQQVQEGLVGLRPAPYVRRPRPRWQQACGV